jgi:ribosome-associated toxin RatA of RatAB toxin-antitoxin module
MSVVERSALVNYSAQEMYDLVNDVNQYVDFLPGCVASEVLEETSDSMLAVMEMRKGPIHQTFTTRNSLIKGESIVIELKNGPFKFLNGQWKFRDLKAGACKVELELKFEFSNQVVALAFGRIFNELTSRLVDSFVARAKVVYGN